MTSLAEKFGQWQDSPENHPCEECGAAAGEPCSVSGPFGFVHIVRLYTPEANARHKAYYEWERRQRETR